MAQTRLRFLAPLCALSIVLGACGDDNGEQPEATDSSPTADAPCESVEAAPPKKVNLDPPPAKPSADDLTAVFETTCGTFEVALDTEGNPKTAASIEYLIESGVYDDTTFHRIAVAPPIIQGGDPLGSGTGGPGYSVDDPPAQDTAYTQGVMAMAKTAAEPPGRSGSQFFIVTTADAGLPPDYAVAGEVSEGFEVIEEIASKADTSGASEMPTEPINIISATIEAG